MSPILAIHKENFTIYFIREHLMLREGEVPEGEKADATGLPKGLS
jgi:hypothetical protein